MKNFRLGVIFFIPLFLIGMNVSAQEKSDYDVARAEIVKTFGTVPSMFEAFPEYALAGAWESFKQLQGPDCVIPPKYRELIQLAVAAQIPCVYCVYFHRAAASAFGATEEEINEAVAHGANTRHWSMIIQGNQVEFEDFKKEFDAMMAFMSEQAEK